MDQTDENTLPNVDVSADLAQMLSRFPLPDGVPDVDMNQAEIAQALNVTTNTVGKWVARSVDCGLWSEDASDFMPVVEVGGPGKAYVLRLSHVYAWRESGQQRMSERTRRVQEAQRAMQANFLNLGEDDLGDGLDHKTRKAIAEADFMHSKAAQMRRSLVQLSEVTELFETVLRIVREGIESMPDRLERELGLTPEKTVLVNRIGDDILNAMADRIEEAELRERGFDDAEQEEAALLQ